MSVGSFGGGARRVGIFLPWDTVAFFFDPAAFFAARSPALASKSIFVTMATISPHLRPSRHLSLTHASASHASLWHLSASHKPVFSSS